MSLNNEIIENRGDAPPAVDKGSVEGGAAAGIAAGLFALGAHFLWALSTSRPPLEFLRLTARTFVVSESALLGLILHLVTSAVLGLIFAVAAGWRLFGKPRVPVGDRAVAGGIAFASLVWALSTFVALPVVNPVLRDYARANPGWWWTLHALFGIGLAVAPLLRARFSTSRRKGDQLPPTGRQSGHGKSQEDRRAIA